MKALERRLNSWKTRLKGVGRVDSPIMGMESLDDSAATLAALKAEAGILGDLASRAQKAADWGAVARLRAIRGSILESVERIQRAHEARGDADDDPEVAERESLEFLRSRGWRCER